MIKFISATCLIFVFTKNATAQQDTALANRLNELLKHTERMDFDKVMDYTYPKLFTVAPREQLKEVLKNSFETEEYSSALDSLKIDTIFPVFTINDESFAKAKHVMLMRMKFKGAADTSNTENGKEILAGLMETQFGKGNVRFDKPNNTIVIFILSDIIAVKNKEDDKWYFVNYDEENEMMLNMLFSKEVQDKLKEYK